MTAPTARELVSDAQWQADHDNVVPYFILLASRVEKVLALHKPIGSGRYKTCEHCGDEQIPEAPFWPCPTVRLLNGEEA